MNILPVNYPSASGAMALRLVSSITDEIIHHSAGSLTQTPLDIDTEHRARGMDMIGYNYVITPDGKTYTGRPIIYVPAAAYGRNSESINICVIGNFQSDDSGYTGPPTENQLHALTDLSIFLHHKYSTIIRTIGHRDVASMFYPNNESDYSTACPGDKLYTFLPELKADISKAMASL